MRSPTTISRHMTNPSYMLCFAGSPGIQHTLNTVQSSLVDLLPSRYTETRERPANFTIDEIFSEQSDFNELIHFSFIHHSCDCIPRMIGLVESI